MYRLLVVDDETDVCDFVKHFFEERAYYVVTAHNGEEAVRAARKERFDVILLDVRMGGMDGITALKKLKEIKCSATVIMVTAVEEQNTVEEACSLGAFQYITKPLILEELERAVYENVRRVRTAS